MDLSNAYAPRRLWYGFAELVKGTARFPLQENKARSKTGLTPVPTCRILARLVEALSKSKVPLGSDLILRTASRAI